MKITDFMERHGAFEADDKEIYFFGTQQGLIYVLNLATLIFVGIISGAFWQMLFFALAFIPLRSFAGGYHTSTQLKCYMSSTAMAVIVALATRLVVMNSLLISVMLLMFTAVIMFMSPVGNRNKPLDDLEVKVYRKKARIICVVEFLMAVMFLFIGVSSITTGIFWAFAVMVLLLVLEKLFGGKT
ncbi:MAG: accessory gene regulator B family protein [Defluviitaleaceae bacterium]|nr:accessory gene regulator B family protein [Defluviitaleaceae bacterium]